MNYKPSSSRQAPLDIPPVPAATRYVSAVDPLQPLHLGPWVTDLVDQEFQEIDLPEEFRHSSRFFTNKQNKTAIHLFDAIAVPEASRISTTNLSILDSGTFLTIHLAIASPEQLRLSSADPLNQQLIALQNPTSILESFQYEKFLCDEILSASPWGACYFSSLISELVVPIVNLDEKQQLIARATDNNNSKLAASLFISMFASQVLKTSFPELASYSQAIIPAGKERHSEELSPWASAVVQEWLELSAQHSNNLPVYSNEDITLVISWLKDTVDHALSINTTATHT